MSAATDERAGMTLRILLPDRVQMEDRLSRRGVWFGLGMFGLVGWAVAIPTLLGIAAGVWIDRRTAGPYSWTLMGLMAGVVLGCINAWFWVRKESRRD
jgi:ATP synthase protein I